MSTMTRVKALTAILVIVFLMPTAVGHGANSYSFIMRNQSIQPSEAQVLDNSTIIFYNTAENNRTILVDSTGDEVDNIQCETGPSNTSSINDECRIWLEPGKWEAGEYTIKIMSNGTLWNTLNLTILLDNHTETSSFDLAAPANYSFNNDPVDELGTETRIANIYQIGLLAIIITGLFLSRKRS
ncbi:MAG: hypothetical protein ACI9SZ_000562 [Candidatus Thalassarchaeaceae archaeon]